MIQDAAIALATGVAVYFAFYGAVWFFTRGIGHNEGADE